MKRFINLPLLTLLLPSIVLSTSCSIFQSGEKLPKQKVEDFLKASFPVKDKIPDRTIILKHLSGDAKDLVSKMSQENLNQLLLPKNRVLEKITFKDERAASDQKMFLTVELRYQERVSDPNQSPNPSQSQAVNPPAIPVRVIQLRLFTLENLEPEGWLITQIKTLKETVEYEGDGLNISL